MKRFVAGVLIALVGAGANACAWAQIAYNPQIFDIPIDTPGATNAFRLINETSEDKHVRVSVVNWELDESNRVQVIPSTEQSLDQWMVINPTDFVLKAGTNQAIRFSIRPAIKLDPGEHRAMVFFEEILPPEDPAHPALRARFRIGAAVYGQVGTPVRKGAINEINTSAEGFSIRVASEGTSNARFSGQYTVWKKLGFPGIEKVPVYPNIGQSDFQSPPGVVRAGLLPNNAILPGTERTVPGQFAGEPLAPGDYVLTLQGSFGESPVKQVADFTVSPPAHKR